MKQILPLKNIKIIDFTRLLPGPLGTHLLSQMGAKITKIESPKRMDTTRHYQPKINNVSVLFHALNHTKKQCIIDYETEEGYKEIIKIIQTADVLVEQFRPGAMKAFKLDYDVVKKINPKIVYISITGYGQTGKNSLKAGHDLNFISENGLLSLNKDKYGTPLIPGFQLADIAGGSYMLIAACTTGLLAQKLQNKAQFISISLCNASASIAVIPQAMLQGGMPYQKTPILSGLFVNYNVYQCQDKKWIALAALELKFWNLFCEVIEKPRWKTDNTDTLIVGRFDKKKLEELFSTKPRNTWVETFKNHDVCLSPVLELEEVNRENDTGSYGPPFGCFEG
ncbi:MAG: carnitine dehydratase [Flavobacteriaceae bacterium]|nr:MAG: carnitine dehydratase [Flavobacteriaceae bacterium]